MKSMLDRAMEAPFSKEQADKAEEEYLEVFNFLYGLFDGEPFKIVQPEDSRAKVSAALYDASMVAAQRLQGRWVEIMADKQNVQTRLEGALKDPDDYEIIVGRGNTAEAVRSRIALLQSILLP